jgi:hypothetical protein
MAKIWAHSTGSTWRVGDEVEGGETVVILASLCLCESLAIVAVE